MSQEKTAVPGLGDGFSANPKVNYIQGPLPN